MLLKELPHHFVGRDILRRLAEEAERRWLAGPSVYALFDDDQLDLSPVFAIAVGTGVIAGTERIDTEGGQRSN